MKTQEFARAACIVNGAPEPIAVDLGATPMPQPQGAAPVAVTTDLATLARTDHASVAATVVAACTQINGTPVAGPVTVETVPPAPKPKPRPPGPTAPGGPPSIGEAVGAGAPSATP